MKIEPFHKNPRVNELIVLVVFILAVVEIIFVVKGIIIWNSTEVVMLDTNVKPVCPEYARTAGMCE